MTLQIDIGGKMRGIKFTMLSLEKFEEKIPFTKKPENAKIIYATFWAGLIGYAEARPELDDNGYGIGFAEIVEVEENGKIIKKVIPYTFEDVTDWVDKLWLENKTEIINEVCEAWAQADMFKNRIKQVEDWANKVRSLTEEDGLDGKTPKKKAIPTSNGLKSKSLPLVH